MKDIWEIVIALVRTARYRFRLAASRFAHWWRGLVWKDRVCKVAGCDKHLLTLHRGKYCWLHSHQHRVHTVLVILGKAPK